MDEAYKPLSAALDSARAILAAEGCTCVLCSDAETIRTHERGVRPLLTWLEEGRTLAEFAAADKVIGKAAAFLYVLLGVGRVHAAVISRPALSVLEAYRIPVSFDVLTDAIRNRTNTGFCPMETAVQHAASPEEALAAIRETLATLQK